MIRTYQISAAASLCVAFLLVTACDTPGPPSLDPATHQADVESWREYRYDLLHEEGWLSLTGLHWLEPGVNSFGAGTQNTILFHGTDLPERIGAFILLDGRVNLQLDPGVTVFQDGELVGDGALRTDADSITTVLTVGSVSWHVIERGERLAVRVQDSLAPTLVEFAGIPSFPVAPEWRFAARFERYDPPKAIQVPNVIGTVNESPSPGAVVFNVGRRTYRLDVVRQPADSAFWIQFGDETNGVDTYGGGRYVWVNAPTDGDDTILDFNKSYNPPCVFTAYATCPLPPRQNKLALRIEAGELAYQPD